MKRVTRKTTDEKFCDPQSRFSFLLRDDTSRSLNYTAQVNNEIWQASGGGGDDDDGSGSSSGSSSSSGDGAGGDGSGSDDVVCVMYC